MPYRREEIDDLDCDIVSCGHNEGGFCWADEDVEDLRPDDLSCYHYYLEKKKEFIEKSEYKIQEIIDNYEASGIKYKEIEKNINRLVLKNINNKSTLFRISKEGEEEYYFFPSTEGGIDFVHKSIRDADLFKDNNIQKGESDG